VVTGRQIFIHVGLPKSGTTYLQNALWASRDVLADRGILFPGDAPDAQRRAAWDLLGRRLRGVDQPHVPGSWQRLVAEVQAWDGDKILISEEFLVHARPKHMRRMENDFATAEMHVVLTVRDLERTILSMWQQELAMSRTWTLPEFVAAVRDPAAGPATAGVRFWLRFDLVRILKMWEGAVPAERIHVVVVPPSDAPSSLLADRFSESIALDPGSLKLPENPVNTSVGVTAAEVLRRLNTSLSGRLNDRQYAFLIEQVIRPALRECSGPPVRLPPQELPWLTQRTLDLADVLGERPYHVVGDPSELVPRSAPADQLPDQVDEAAQLEVALTALSATMEHYSKYRAKQAQRTKSRATTSTKVASSARALTFKARFSILESADRNKLAARAANFYLRRLSRQRKPAPRAAVTRVESARPAQKRR